jgi:thymidylate synthase (FAD)
MTLSAEQLNQIKEQRRFEAPTRRETCAALEDILYTPFPALDHGFIRVLDYMGNDSSIVAAARVSYGRGTKRISEDKGLIEYLIRHRHSTPIEQCEIKFHMRLPIFVARQLIRHRTANVNEYSARYSILANEFYIPEQQNLAPQSVSNRQGRSLDHLDELEAKRVQEELSNHQEFSYKLYHTLLAEDKDRFDLPGPVPIDTKFWEEFPGIARELARMVLPLNIYTEWVWKIDLHNLLHFLSLRMDKHAQYEIRVYADIIGSIVEKWCPFAWEAWNNCVFNGIQLTAKQWEIIRYHLEIPSELGVLLRENENEGFAAWQKRNNIGKREFDELIEILYLKG